MQIKIRLLELGKKQTDLLAEVHKRGYPRLTAGQLSGYINNTIPGPQRDAVIELCHDILDEWKK